MWSNMMYMLPVASILSMYEIKEEIKMEGDLLTELDHLLLMSKCVSNFKIEKSDLKCKVSLTYPAGSNLWTIIDSIINRYRLIASVSIQDPDIVVLRLSEGSAWMH